MNITFLQKLTPKLVNPFIALSLLTSSPGSITTAKAQNELVSQPLPFGQDAILLDMSHHELGTLPVGLEQIEAYSLGNTAHVALTAVPGQEGWVDALVGTDIQWDLGSYDWEEVKDLPFEVTVMFSYELEAYWVQEHGSANAFVAIHALALPTYDFIGFETGETGVRGGDVIETYTATLENWYGVFFQVYSQVHSTGDPPDGNGAIHSSSAEITVHGIIIDFPPYDEKFSSTAQYDGWILESAESSNVGGIQNKSGSTLRIGDDAANKQFRSILSFDTSAIPEGVTITSATLKFKHAGVSGTNPFRTHGSLLADIRRGPFKGRAALELGDFNAPAHKNSVLIFTNNKVDGWYSQSLNPLDFQFIDPNGVTQFRIRFARDDNNDFGADFLKLFSGNAAEANRPQLVIQYYVMP